MYQFGSPNSVAVTSLQGVRWLSFPLQDQGAFQDMQDLLPGMIMLPTRAPGGKLHALQDPFLPLYPREVCFEEVRGLQRCLLGVQKLRTDHPQLVAAALGRSAAQR